MPCATTSGTASRIFCRVARAMSAARQKTIACSAKRCSTAIERAVRGVICPSGSASVWRGFPNHYLCESWVVGLREDRPMRRYALRDAGAQAIGRSRGGLSTKIHALVDALGNPANLRLTPGQDHDLAGAAALLENADPGALIGDKAYTAFGRHLGKARRGGHSAALIE